MIEKQERNNLSLHDSEVKPNTHSTHCRLCGHKTKFLFQRKILRKYETAFYECSHCDSLQTENPYWINEAYADQRRVLDVGAVLRIQKLRRITFLLFHILKFNSDAKILDWGSGDGLFVRMLRDDGLNAYCWDKYALNMYASGFERSLDEHYSFVTSFEVFEHLTNPQEEIEQIFMSVPDVLLVTTSLYTKQGPEWKYLNVLTGRHVFFYSPKAMKLIAEKYGYQLELLSDGILFYRFRLSAIHLWLVRYIVRASNTRVGHLLYTIFRKKSLISTDREYVENAVGAGKLWPLVKESTINDTNGRE